MTSQQGDQKSKLNVENSGIQLDPRLDALEKLAKSSYSPEDYVLQMKEIVAVDRKFRGVYEGLNQAYQNIRGMEDRTIKYREQWTKEDQ